MKQILKKKLNSAVSFALIGSLLGLIAGFISTLLDASGSDESLSISLLGFVLGLLLGFQFGILEEFIWRPLSKKVSFGIFLTLQFFSYLSLISIWLIIAIASEHVINDGLDFYEGIRLYLDEEDFARDVIFANFMTMLLMIFGKQRMLHSSKELLSLFTGKYHYPEREIRSIMFVDLAGSTSLAEKLGAVKFSSFLQDYFSDLSESILAWGGEVYQYLGDGIVVSWNNNSKGSGINPLSCYFEMVKTINDKQDYYLKLYGAFPQFRAGIHKGEIIITWVGEKRKELAFHGDTINTAARIEALCKEYDRYCLVSEELLKDIILPENFTVEKIGTVTPRGKSKNITLFSISVSNPEASKSQS